MAAMLPGKVWKWSRSYLLLPNAAILRLTSNLRRYAETISFYMALKRDTELELEAA